MSVEQALETGVVDEIIVINNNAEQGTSAEVAKTSAREVFEVKQGYGHAIRRGFSETRGDLIVVSEPDGTFTGKDILKLLAYADDFPVVFGTRTCTALYAGNEQANMRMFVRYGNVMIAKLIELLFNTVTLTDVGCTMRLFDRKALASIAPSFRSGGSDFGLELMLLTITSNIRWVQIPVSYRPRVGKSSVTGDLNKALALGLRMVVLVARTWASRFWRPRFKKQAFSPG